ncbi:MAG: TonB-dependent receptor [Crocinitomix sp.]|nr:TonB-dependent receptor [Crocinitomix sp.]
MRYLILLTILTFQLISSSCFAQLGSISGTVSDEFGPLPGAKVKIIGTDLSISCDINGAYTFEIKPGKYSVSTSYLLYKTQKISADISFNHLNADVDFVLESGSVVDADISIGSRAKPKSQMENIAAVDVISPTDISTSAQISLSQILHYLVPSFHSTSQTISDGTDHTAPATLRGLAPDQVLVLVNGKRRHTSSLINVNGTVGRGSVGTDFDAIPVSAIDRIEILRDGAAAQYGSDAISGVINIILKDQTNVFSLNTMLNPTLYGDGTEFLLSTNYGLDLGKGGFVNISAEYKQREALNRAGNYIGNIYTDNDSLDALLIEQNDFFGQLTDYNEHQIMQIGSSKKFDGTVFYNAVIPVKGKAELYSNGGVNYRKGESRGFYRLPIESQKVVLDLFPNGFSPEIHTDIIDKSLSIGMRGTRNGWHVDFSNSTGTNEFDITVKNSINASLGVASPINNFAGGFKYGQNVTNLDFSKRQDSLGFLHALNMGYGVEFRIEDYQVIKGEESSWIDGGDTNDLGELYQAGVQVFPGFQPQNALDKRRTNVAAYSDLEFHFTKKFLIEAAARYENYTSFGGNLSWKLATRYKFGKNLSVRSSFSTGFRAPSLHQIYFNNLGTQFIDGASYQVGTFNNESPISKAFGIESLKPETSQNFSLGFTSKLFKNFTFNMDFYYIAIKNRIVLSGRFDEGYADILTPVGASSAQFFTNAVNTETVGFDFVPTYSLRVKKGLLRLSGAYNFTSTKTIGMINTPPLLTGSEDILFNREEISRLEVAQPKSKGILTANYLLNKWNIALKTTRFGTVSYIHPNDGNAANWVLNEFTGLIESRDQVFNPKWITDVFISYKFNNYFTFALGGNNIFNVYPDKHTHSVNVNQGHFVYSRRVQQFGVRGASYFARLSFSL